MEEMRFSSTGLFWRAVVTLVCLLGRHAGPASPISQGPVQWGWAPAMTFLWASPHHPRSGFSSFMVFAELRGLCLSWLPPPLLLPERAVGCDAAEPACLQGLQAPFPRGAWRLSFIERVLVAWPSLAVSMVGTSSLGEVLARHRKGGHRSAGGWPGAQWGSSTTVGHLSS